MNNRSFPSEMLTHIFSFLNNKGYYDLSPLRLVCKEWYKEENQEQLWQQLIRPECHSVFAESKLSAKEFYINNIDARVDTYYFIGSSVGIHLDWKDRISVDKKSLLCFPDIKYKNIYSRSRAMKCVENLTISIIALSSSIYRELIRMF